MGQIVSCRKGLLGEEWVNSLAKLQDRVPARSGQDALDLAYSAFEGGEEEFHRIFTDFDSSPLAAASLGQVVSLALFITQFESFLLFIMLDSPRFLIYIASSEITREWQ